jgi:hypothetical protein
LPVRARRKRGHTREGKARRVPLSKVRRPAMTEPGGTGVDATGRATTRRRRLRHNKIAGQFAPRLIEMLESPAYRVLSVSAHRVLSRIEIEHGHHGGLENGRLPVTVQNFEEYGMDRHAIAPAIRECVALGFVEVTVQGRGGNAEFRQPNQFRLTYVFTADAAATNDWRQIETMEGAQALAIAARRPLPRKPRLRVVAQ